MIVDYLDLPGVAITPDETDPPLLVDANAMLTKSVAAKGLQTVAGRDPRIIETASRVDCNRPGPSPFIEIGGQARERHCKMAAERLPGLDHEPMQREPFVLSIRETGAAARDGDDRLRHANVSARGGIAGCRPRSGRPRPMGEQTGGTGRRSSFRRRRTAKRQGRRVGRRRRRPKNVAGKQRPPRCMERLPAKPGLLEDGQEAVPATLPAAICTGATLRCNESRYVLSTLHTGKPAGPCSGPRRR